MIRPPLDLTNVLDWEALSETSIELSPHHIDRATQLSRSSPNGTQQWQIYLNALALFGFEQWLDEWAPDLSVDDTHCSLFQPPYANLLEVTCNLRVGAFKVCLIPIGNLLDSAIDLPRAVLELPAFVPHLYVLVRVLEETMQVQIYGYLRRDRLVEQQQSQPLRSSNSWTCALPLDWFDLGPAAPLLDLRCLNPETISLPTIAPQSLISVERLQARLTQLRPQLQSSHGFLPQVLTWEEGASLLSHPELVEQVYQLQFSPSPLLQQVIKVGSWLQDQLDAVAQDLSWVLLPAFAPASALRSMESVLEDRGIQVPTQARGAYRDLQVGNAAVRLYAVTWMLSLSTETQGWTLLTILSAQPGYRLPQGIQLRVQDDTQLLVEQALQETADDAYLYAQVGGTQHDRFSVTIALPEGTEDVLNFEF